ncbi:hypothetical protein [Streptomyces sp. NPDC097619]|uniref:hypothetical protein n=1 Tax=Streptomyces sp. NPDC097619 TaxID=3157228 RepID=UPI003318EA89
MRCPLHGTGTDPTRLVGRTIERVLASWHLYDGERSEIPLDVWLLDTTGDATRITTGSDWCLIVESAAPDESYESLDMGAWGRIEIGEDLGDHPLRRHLGETVTSVAEYGLPDFGRTHLELGFPGGQVRADCHEGDLRLTRTGAGTGRTAPAAAPAPRAPSAREPVVDARQQLGPDVLRRR